MTIDRDNAKGLIAEANELARVNNGFFTHDGTLDHISKVLSRLTDALEAALSAAPVEGEVEWECKMPGLGWGACGNTECQNPKRYRRKAGPWEAVPDAE